MPNATPIEPSRLRASFSQALSDMYRREVPLYGTLLELVAGSNRLVSGDHDGRLEVERHGAIRVGTAAELAGIRRLFAVMGMQPVGYYDLATAGVPVHSTAFRPVEAAALAISPFRVFTSLLRLELIGDPELRAEAAAVLERRRIFTSRLLELVALAEQEGGLPEPLAPEFVAEALQTFRWHETAPVDAGLYDRLKAAHPLVADVVCFRGPHINHLTPRTLDIDAVQAAMAARGMNPKAVIEGPPRRAVPILLRQTSFHALNEPVRFAAGAGPASGETTGTHTARFGEVEQRGAALTAKGRALYDRLLSQLQSETADGADRTEAASRIFAEFPDTARELREHGLAFFHPGSDEPLLYEDFLPVSAAGIFRSNLGPNGAAGTLAVSSRADFEAALGTAPLDEMALYEAAAA
ncbi:2-oxoadipate dioxygenase/decarboxylase family protein [Lichenicola sp.]|uniref:2-oxoadipate dioxygenase/decarboxylase family protein n=1 Tax=Lichenicola sp. TaxID=2804529 RepID=UPI003B00AE25